MGDEILMKKLILLSLLVLLAHSDQNKIALVADYDSMFKQIGKKRFGVNSTEIDALKSPFVTVKKDTKRDTNDTVLQKEKFILNVIMQKRAKINDHWYRLGDDVDGLKLVSIDKKMVILKNSEKTQRLIIRRKNEKFSIK